MLSSNKYPRVLVVSINSFSRSESNGKVMAQMFLNWDKKCLAQFFVYNDTPDSAVCDNYFRVTDVEALKSTFCIHKLGGRIKRRQDNETNTQSTDVVSRPVKRNPFTCLMRDIVWNLGLWKSKELSLWIKSFNPEVVFVMAGGSSFIHNIAMGIAKQFQIPLVVFNTEKYYFLNENYMKGYGGAAFYPVYHAECRRAFRRLMRKSSLEIYGNEVLEKIFRDEFGKPGTVLYQPTSVVPFVITERNCPQKFSYIGTLGYKRPDSLAQIGKQLSDISKDYYIDIYGKCPDEDTKIMLENAPGVRYHGFVSAEQVIEIIKDSDILFHAESFDTEILPILQTGFSTKISDSLASGRCLVLYADTSIACAKYLIENDCALVITSPAQLEEKLRDIVSNKGLREHYIQNAVKIAERNHNADKNCEILRSKLENIVRVHNENLSN